jgi:hypothetical protein|tara:strand:+ start:123 stop:548 length:426 start_codon:yes stop_codon:yes gene_type:complete
MSDEKLITKGTDKTFGEKPGKTKDKKPTTVEQALDQGYEQKGFMMPSDPPVLFFEKNGEVIRIRPKPDYKPDLNKFPKGTLKPGGPPTKAAKGGLMEATAKLKAKGMKDGGMAVKNKVVASDKSPNSGMITQRGWGASRKT